jgi:alkyl hydroperoxide reductase subunit F
MQRRTLNVPGEKKLLRRGISHALSQDLPIFAGKSVAVVGGGNSALQSSLELAKNKCQVIIVSKSSWTADPSLSEEARKLSDLVVLDSHKVVEIKGEDAVEGIAVRNLRNDRETFYRVDGVFIAIGHSPNSFLVSHLVDLNEKKEIVVNPDCSTRTPGLFACGDVTNTLDKRIIIASGEGAKAALAARRYLLKSSPPTL